MHLDRACMLFALAFVVDKEKGSHIIARIACNARMHRIVCAHYSVRTIQNREIDWNPFWLVAAAM